MQQLIRGDTLNCTYEKESRNTAAAANASTFEWFNKNMMAKCRAF